MRGIKGIFLHPRGGPRKSLRLAFKVAAFIGVAAIGCARERDAASELRSETRNEADETPGGAAVLRRLEAVTWNPVTDELTWVVSAGSKSTGAYQPGATDTYMIHLESATMRFKGEGRHFSEDEAEGVHVLMDIISRYAVEATVWWETGHGEKLDDKGNPVPDPKGEDNKKPSPSVGRPGVPTAKTHWPVPPPATAESASRLDVTGARTAGFGECPEK
jgi:hypothetical protein